VKHGAIVHVGTEVPGVQFAEMLFDDEYGFPDQRRAVVDFLETLRRGRMP
jgi:hypothetical protein